MKMLTCANLSELAEKKSQEQPQKSLLAEFMGTKFDENDDEQDEEDYNPESDDAEDEDDSAQDNDGSEVDADAEEDQAEEILLTPQQGGQQLKRSAAQPLDKGKSKRLKEES